MYPGGARLARITTLAQESGIAYAIAFVYCLCLDRRAELAHTSAKSRAPLVFYWFLFSNLPTERDLWLCLNQSRFAPGKYSVLLAAILRRRLPPVGPATLTRAQLCRP